MKPWYGEEIVDIIYNNTKGIFTALLINYGYLDTKEWRDKHLKYYIKVKTTIGPLRTPFYISKY